MSGNHNGVIERALVGVKAAHESVDAIKLQHTRQIQRLSTIRADYLISMIRIPYGTKNLYELYQEAYTPMGLA